MAIPACMSQVGRLARHIWLAAGIALIVGAATGCERAAWQAPGRKAHNFGAFYGVLTPYFDLNARQSFRK